MTTGRINQVTTIPNAPRGAFQGLAYRLPRGLAFGSAGVHQRIRSLLQTQKVKAANRGSAFRPGGVQASPTICGLTSSFPDLTKFKHTSPRLLKETEIVAFGEDYQRPVTPSRHTAVAADPRVVI